MLRQQVEAHHLLINVHRELVLQAQCMINTEEDRIFLARESRQGPRLKRKSTSDHFWRQINQPNKLNNTASLDSAQGQNVMTHAWIAQAAMLWFAVGLTLGS